MLRGSKSFNRSLAASIPFFSKTERNLRLAETTKKNYSSSSANRSSAGLHCASILSARASFSTVHDILLGRAQRGGEFWRNNEDRLTVISRASGQKQFASPKVASARSRTRCGRAGPAPNPAAKTNFISAAFLTGKHYGTEPNDQRDHRDALQRCRCRNLAERFVRKSRSNRFSASTRRLRRQSGDHAKVLRPIGAVR